MDYKQNFNLAVSPEQAYNAWISEDMTIAPVVKIEVDPNPGGRFVLHAKNGAEIFLMEGTFIDLQPFHKISYHWQWQGTEEVTTVTVNFTSIKGGCLLGLTHEGFLSEESKERHRVGWEYYVSQLEQRLKV